MAKTGAERQKQYRAKRPFAGDNGEKRFNTWVTTRTHLAMERLAKRYGVTKRELIERLVIAEEEKVLKDIKLDSPEGEQYLGR